MAQYFSVSKIDFDKTKIKNLKKRKILKQYNMGNILLNDNNNDDHKSEIRLQKNPDRKDGFKFHTNSI